MNARQPHPAAGRHRSTNPCGEQPLLPTSRATSARSTWPEVRRRTGRDRLGARWARWCDTAVRFLDDVIDVNALSRSPQIEEITHGNRKIGLGVMGFADLLIAAGRALRQRGGNRARRGAHEVHRRPRLADGLGGSGREARLVPELRGASGPPGASSRCATPPRTTIAPTGTISIIAGCSSGIEPLFAVCLLAQQSWTGRAPRGQPLLRAVARGARLLHARSS